MLDQNTDRTWWMIGALVIGVAIVVLIKTAFPELVTTVITKFKTLMDSWLKEVNPGTGMIVGPLKMFLP